MLLNLLSSEKRVYENQQLAITILNFALIWVIRACLFTVFENCFLKENNKNTEDTSGS